MPKEKEKSEKNVEREQSDKASRRYALGAAPTKRRSEIQRL